MIMRTFFRAPLNAIAVVSLCTLAACGGGGGGGGDAPAPASQPPPVQRTSFTVSLESINVQRASNGEPISVDTAGITQSLTFEQ